MLITISLILFAIAAVLGLSLVIMYLQKGALSNALAAFHGIFAASGLIVLAIAAGLEKTSQNANLSLAIFVIAAIGGFILLYNHLTKGKLPKPLLIIHPIAAILAFIILLVSAFKV